MKKTSRGFNIYGEYTDTYGNKVRIQESSAAMKHCVWIFTEDKDGKSAKEHCGELVSASPHLTKAQARKVARALLKFADSE